MSIMPIHRGLSGDVIVQFKRPAAANLTALETLMSSAPLPSGARVEVEPLIRSLSFPQIAALESSAAAPASPISLRSFYRVFLRANALSVAQLDAVVAYLYTNAAIAYAYLERSVALATSWRDPAFAPDQAHLDPAPAGIGARDFWSRDPSGASAAGKNTHLYAIEHGWDTRHADLLSRKLGAPIWGDNAANLPKPDITALRRINHGTSALSAAVGGIDTPGRVGVAPRVASVRLCSCYEAARDIGEHVAAAIAKVVHNKAQRGVNGAVLMLQVQRDFGWPTEVDLADFLAIRLAVRHGILVIEPAGNGARDLSGLPWPDSGALMVGALGAQGQRLASSNYGARVNAWAPGEGLRCSGAPLTRGVPDYSGGSHTTIRRDDFSGTSAATAVVAGLALCTAGRALSRNLANFTTMDLREWLREPLSEHRHLSLGALDDGLLVAAAPPLPSLTLNKLSFPWTRGASRLAGVCNPLRVSNPQAGEGNTDVVERDPAYPSGNPDKIVGFVRLPPLNGQNMPHSTPGDAPVTSGQNDPPWVERWVLTEGAVMTSPPDVMVLQFDDGDSTSNPNGQIWGQDVIDYFQARSDYNSDWRLAEVSFHYKSVPPAPNPSISDSGCTKRHFDIHRNHSGSWIKVGELRRQIKSATEVTDHWMLFGNYLFADAGKDVRLTRNSGAESTSTQSWLGDMYTASQGSPPKPNWYAKASYNIVNF